MVPAVVTPCMGVWIETDRRWSRWGTCFVTPCMGVWIETLLRCSGCRNRRPHPVWVCGLKLCRPPGNRTLRRSHPVWVCGLKPNIPCMAQRSRCHTLYGCVDWNTKEFVKEMTDRVTPCMGVWIETSSIPTARPRQRSHTLYGCVDWNLWAFLRAIWDGGSHPVWVCRLKHPYLTIGTL